MSSRRSVKTNRSPASSAPPSVEFQRQWQAGKPPRIEAFLFELPAISISDLAAVVRVDLRHRWRSGEGLGASDYLTRFPQLHADPTLVIDLIYTEYLVREELGEHAHLSDLQLQFPQYAAELADQVEFHSALEDFAPETCEEQLGIEAETKQPRDTLGPAAKPRPRLPSLAPAYEVLDEIGRGGMGVVYRARQVGLNRLVALKMVRSAEYASDELLARFRAEAEVVARLHHPNIVQIFDYGEHDGLPYLALELVEGPTLAARLDAQSWSNRDAAALVANLAVAVQFAHERGVIHRDLKPANILLESRQVENESGSPAPHEIAKITDFGLAKVFRDDADAQTHTGSVLGTPSYMSPEQASGQGELIGPQTDVYALGAILYELLAGRPAFRGSTVIGTLQQVMDEQPVELRRLNPRVPRDLVTICDKCLSKEPAHRYISAAALASDLQRFLEDRPIQARRISALERGWRTCRRNPAIATLGTFVALLLLAVATVSSISSVRLGAELKKRERAQSAERDATQTAQLRLWDAYLAEVRARIVSRQLGHRFDTLETVEQASALLHQIGRTPDRERQLRNATIAALTLADLRPLRRIECPSTSFLSCALSANRYVAALSDGDLAVRDLDGRELLHIEHHGESVIPAISRDGRNIGMSDNAGSKVWRINGPESAVVWEEVGARRLALAPDCRHAAVVGADRLMHWIDLDSGKDERQLGRGEAQSSFSFHESSRRIAVVGDESVQIISWETGAVLAELPHPTGIADIAWHPGGEHVAVSGEDGGVALWHVASGRRVLTYPHPGVLQLSFVGQGDYLLTHNIWDSHLILWQTATGHQVLSDPTFPKFSVEQTSEGRNFLFVKASAEAALWEIETAPACSVLPHSMQSTPGWRLSASISPDGRLLMLGCGNGLELWDLERQQLAGRLESALAFATFIDDGSIVARSASGIFHWPRHQATGPMDSTTSEIVFGPPRQLFGETDEPKFAISPDGKLLVARDPEGWRVSGSAAALTLTTAPNFEQRTVAIAPDAKWIALGSWYGHGISIFSPYTGEQVAHVSAGLYAWPAFSPNNRLLATTSDGVRVWSTADWQRVADVRARGDTASDLGIAFSPDSRVLAVSQPTGTTRFVDPLTGRDWAVLTHPDQNAGGHLSFSQDQRWLVTTSVDERRAVRCWDLSLIRKELFRLGLDWPAEVLRTSPTSNHATTALEVSFDRGTEWPKQEALAGDVGQTSDRAKALILGGRAHLSVGKWREAADDLAKVVELVPNDLEVAFEYPAALLLAGDSEAYQRFSANALEPKWKSLNQPGRRSYLLARICLMDEQTTNLNLATRLANEALKEDKVAWHLHTVGLAHYRAHQYQEAIARSHESLAADPNWKARPLNWLVLAMAHHQLGDHEEARQWFDKTMSAIKKAHVRDTSDPSQRWSNPEMHAHDWAAFLLLLREAEGLMRADDSPRAA